MQWLEAKVVHDVGGKEKNDVLVARGRGKEWRMKEGETYGWLDNDGLVGWTYVF